MKKYFFIVSESIRFVLEDFSKIKPYVLWSTGLYFLSQLFMIMLTGTDWYIRQFDVFTEQSTNIFFEVLDFLSSLLVFTGYTIVVSRAIILNEPTNMRHVKELLISKTPQFLLISIKLILLFVVFLFILFIILFIAFLLIELFPIFIEHEFIFDIPNAIYFLCIITGFSCLMMAFVASAIDKKPSLGLSLSLTKNHRILVMLSSMSILAAIGLPLILFYMFADIVLKELVSYAHPAIIALTAASFSSIPLLTNMFFASWMAHTYQVLVGDVDFNDPQKDL